MSKAPVGLTRARRRTGRVVWAAVVGALVAAAPSVAAQQRSSALDRAGRLLGELVASYGVSGDEGAVRETVLRHLPAWARARAVVDTAGNLWVRAGQGDPLVVFVAHLDETGFQVTGIRDDGTLVIRSRGGFLPWLWEATPALVHTADGPVPGVFTPRDSVERRPLRQSAGGFRVDVGARSRREAEAMGIRAGITVTNPKQVVRLAGTRITARSFDDRVGSAAQVLALQALDPRAFRHEVVFLWVVREEIGLEGAHVAARELGVRPVRVHAVDTFVSADGPHDLRNFAAQPIGAGPVARVVDNSSVTPPPVVDTLRRLAARRRIPLQVGTTNGGNDGSAFTAWGVVDVPIGWPLRYSHSPVEVIDLNDLVELARLVQVIATEW